MTSNKLSGIWSVRSELLYKICYHIQFIFGGRDYANPVLEVVQMESSNISTDLRTQSLTLIVSYVDISSLVLKESPDQAMVTLVCSCHQGSPALRGFVVDGHILGLEQSRNNLCEQMMYDKMQKTGMIAPQCNQGRRL